MLLTRAPIAFLSMVDTDCNYFKSCLGMPEPVAKMYHVSGRTFSPRAILKDGPLAVNDTKVDHLWRDITSVKDLGGPHT